MSRSQLLLSWFRWLGHAVILLAAVGRLLAAINPRFANWLEGRFNFRSFDLPLSLVLVLMFILNFVIGLFYVPTRSMVPTLEVYDGIVANLVSYHFRKPRLNEIVVFKGQNGQYLVKRIVATEGDNVRIDKGVLYRNDMPQRDFLCGSQEMMATHQVGTESVFVMGDNRTNSMDSRAFGDVGLSNLSGPVVFRYWPIRKIGTP